MENTTELVKQLSNQLGTTTEYLWSILINQAPIDATISLIQILIIVLIGFFLLKAHNYLSNDTKELSYDNNDIIGIFMTSAVIIYAILLIGAICMISDVINGYFNPEYWSLNRILNALK